MTQNGISTRAVIFHKIEHSLKLAHEMAMVLWEIVDHYEHCPCCGTECEDLDEHAADCRLVAVLRAVSAPPVAHEIKGPMSTMALLRSVVLMPRSTAREKAIIRLAEYLVEGVTELSPDQRAMMAARLTVRGE